MEEVGQFSMKMTNKYSSTNNSPTSMVDPLLTRLSAVHRNNMVSFAAAAALAKANFIEKNSTNLFESMSVDQTNVDDDDDDDDDSTIIEVDDLSTKRDLTVDQICPKIRAVDEINSKILVSGTAAADSSSEKQNVVSVKKLIFFKKLANHLRSLYYILIIQ